jgi:hypothetical protein
MQWSPFTEEKKKNQLAQIEFRFTETIIIKRGEQLLVALRLHVSFALDQKTANFKVAYKSRAVQWSVSAVEKQKNQLARTEKFQSFA